MPPSTATRTPGTPGSPGTPELPGSSGPAGSPPAPRVVVAGAGLLSPLGQSAWETFTALLAGRTIADRCANLPEDVAPVDLIRAVGSVRVAHHAGGDPAVELAERAAREACTAAGIDPAGLPAFLGASKGAVATLSTLTKSAPKSGATKARTQRSADACLALSLGPHGYLTHKLRQRLRLGLARHYVAACASSLTALHHAHRFLTAKPALRSEATKGRMPAEPDHALVLTSEAALLPAFIHSYRRLGVLAPLTPAAYRELPLDAARGGFMLSELGAAVLLRRLPDGAEPEPGQIELIASDVACEADDLIRPSPTMEALGRVATRLFAKLPPDTPLDMVHPHAPGTADHDPTELRVLQRALSSPLPGVYAAKGALGHGLGAAGLAALVLACLCLTAGQRPPMPWLTNPIEEARDTIGDPAAPAPCSRRAAHAIFSAGFAGHVAGALIRRW